MKHEDLSHTCLVLAALMLLPLRPAAGQENRKGYAEHPGTAVIRGVISISQKGNEAQQSQDLLRERYAPTGAHQSIITPDQPQTTEWTLSERAVVYLEDSSRIQGTFPPPEKHPMLNQKNLEFHPRVLPIVIGTTVDFPNRDDLFHNVFSYSKTKEFDLGRYPRNASRSVTFERPGVVRVYCDIHAHMNATILVLQNPYFATPAENGSYVIGHIPEGSYTLVFWYDRDVVERRPVKVKAGELLEMNIQY